MVWGISGSGVWRDRGGGKSLGPEMALSGYMYIADQLTTSGKGPGRDSAQPGTGQSRVITRLDAICAC